MTSHVSCRVPETLGKKIDETADQYDTSRSDVLRQAIQQYVDQTDGATESANSQAEGRADDLDRSAFQPIQRRPYDPTEDL